MRALSKRTGLAMVTAVALVGIAARPTAQDPQRTFGETPQFVPTAVTVTGAVSVDNSPTVHAQQAGEWSVNLARPPVVYWRVPAFLAAGRTYRFGSSLADATTYRVMELGLNGWVRVQPVDHDAGSLAIWLNVDRVTVIEDVDR